MTQFNSACKGLFLACLAQGLKETSACTGCIFQTVTQLIISYKISEVCPPSSQSINGLYSLTSFTCACTFPALPTLISCTTTERLITDYESGNVHIVTLSDVCALILNGSYGTLTLTYKDPDPQTGSRHMIFLKQTLYTMFNILMAASLLSSRGSTLQKHRTLFEETRIIPTSPRGGPGNKSRT